MANEYLLVSGRKLIVEQDDSGHNDYEDCDHVGRIAHWHSRYTITESALRLNRHDDVAVILAKILRSAYNDTSEEDTKQYQALRDAVYRAEDLADRSANSDKVKALCEKHLIMLPIYMFDHSGITIRTYPFGDPWDSGQVGFIFVSRVRAAKECCVPRWTKNQIARVELYLKGAIKDLDNYLTGNRYMFTILDTEGNEEDICWGFSGSNLFSSGIADNLQKDEYEGLKKSEPRMYAEHRKDCAAYKRLLPQRKKHA